VREFKDVAAFLKFFAGTVAAAEVAGHRGVEQGAYIIRDEARREIGHYQDAAGPFDTWAPLSDATLEGFHAAGIGYIPGKVELGYAPPDNPLMRTGELEESIECVAHRNEAAIGSDLDVAVYQELGTPDARFPIPPRSFLGGAAVRKAEVVVDNIAENVVHAIAGLPPRNRPLKT
jgi:phage gpG-like protein